MRFRNISVLCFLGAAVLVAGCESNLMKKKPVTATRVVADDRNALFTAVTIETDRRILPVDEKDQTIFGEPSPEAVDTYSSDFANQIGKAVSKGMF